MKNILSPKTKQGAPDNSGAEGILLNADWASNIILSEDDGVIATDINGNITLMNKVAEKLTGWTKKESMGKPVDSIFDAISEETMLPVKNPINAALMSNKITLLANHTILIKKDKTERVIVDSAIPIHGATGEVVGGALIFRDVTDMAKAQKILIEKNLLLRGFLDNTSLLISIKDLSGLYLLINKQEEKIFKINGQKAIGQSSIGHMSKTRAFFSRKMDKQVIETEGSVEYDETIIYPDHSAHKYHTSKFPLLVDGRHPFAICTVSVELSNTVSDNEAPSELVLPNSDATSAPSFGDLSKNMPNLFFSLDRDLVHTSFNVACETFTGISADKVIGRTMEEAFPAGDPLFLSEYKEVLETGLAKNFITNFSFHNHAFTYIVNIFPTEKGISVLMTDLTMGNPSQEESAGLIERLKQKNKNLRQFAYAFSHDLRAPIARVLGLVSLSDLDPDIIINNKSIMQNVADEVQSLDDVVKDISDGIDIDDAGRDKEYIKFQDQILLIKNVLEKQIVESEVDIRTNFILLEGVSAVKSYLYSILINLLSNSIKFRRTGVPIVVEISSGIEAGMGVLSIKDNGRGIDLIKNKGLVFGLRNRFHSKDVAGTGIGLHLVKSQIESMGGTVTVESEVNKGSTFKVFFPINKKLYVSGE